VIVEANQAVSNYYFRVTTGGGLCDGPNEQNTAGNTKGAIFSYEGAGNQIPTSAPATLSSGCTEESGLIPLHQTTVPSPSNPTSLHLSADLSGAPIWMINGQAIHIDWSKPTLSYVTDGVYTLPPQDNAIVVSNAGWVYLLVQNDTPLPHPIHLHGHDFWVLSESVGNNGVASSATSAGSSTGSVTSTSSSVSSSVTSQREIVNPSATFSPTSTIRWSNTTYSGSSASSSSTSGGASSWAPTSTSSTVWWTPSPSTTAPLRPRATGALNVPIRRDTYTVQGNPANIPGAGGSVLIAYRADNPGAWLLHCHIPWHVSGGLGVQFLERPSEIKSKVLADNAELTNGCSAWNTFQDAASRIVQADSGL
jgi:FtsP/CotA-like multicopper oxidase with cupredoxin domain